MEIVENGAMTAILCPVITTIGAVMMKFARCAVDSLLDVPVKVWSVS